MGYGNFFSVKVARDYISHSNISHSQFPTVKPSGGDISWRWKFSRGETFRGEASHGKISRG